MIFLPTGYGWGSSRWQRNPSLINPRRAAQALRPAPYLTRSVRPVAGCYSTVHGLPCLPIPRLCSSVQAYGSVKRSRRVQAVAPGIRRATPSEGLDGAPRKRTGGGERGREGKSPEPPLNPAPRHCSQQSPIISSSSPTAGQDCPGRGREGGIAHAVLRAYLEWLL